MKYYSIHTANYNVNQLAFSILHTPYSLLKGIEENTETLNNSNEHN